MLQGFISIIVIFLPLDLVWTKNPIVPDVGMADPHGHIFNGRAYIYATHDYSSNNTGFRMDDWWIWSSDDLVNWKKENVLKPSFTPANSSEYHECWATDAALRNGSFFWYLSIGPANVAVMKSDSPVGKWQDPLGVPLLPKGLVKTTNRDPGVLEDDDGTYYIIFGVFNYYIAKLNLDMISLAEDPRPVQIVDAMGPYGPGKTDDKAFLHKYNGNYYLSWGCFYGISNSAYGPFQYIGSFIDSAYIAPDFRVGNETQEPWYSREDYADRHGSFFEFHGQWYFVCNDRSHSTDPKRGYYRDSVMAYVHYYNNGSIAPLVINATGVGQYDAFDGFLEAENYFKITDAQKQENSNSGFKIAGLKNGSVLTYPKIHNIPTNAILILRLSNGGKSHGEIYIHSKSVDGPNLGLCNILPTGSWENYSDISCHLKIQAEQKSIDIVMVFVGSSNEFAHLDKFAFEEPSTEERNDF